MGGMGLLLTETAIGSIIHYFTICSGGINHQNMADLCLLYIIVVQFLSRAISFHNFWQITYLSRKLSTLLWWCLHLFNGHGVFHTPPPQKLSCVACQSRSPARPAAHNTLQVIRQGMPSSQRAEWPHRITIEFRGANFSHPSVSKCYLW